MAKKRAEIIAKGIVQGVGYRHYTLKRASSAGLTGWVKNLDNGNVKIVAEGEEGDINTLVKELRSGPYMSRVDDLETDWQEYSGDFTGFNVRF